AGPWDSLFAILSSQPGQKNARRRHPNGDRCARRSIRPKRTRLPVMLTLWEASSEEALRERMRIGEERLQHHRDRQGGLVPPAEGQRPVAVPLDDHEWLTPTASPRRRPVLGQYRQLADDARSGPGAQQQACRRTRRRLANEDR